MVCVGKSFVLDLVCFQYVVLFCAVSDMVDYTELKRAVNLELTLVLNVCAVNRALLHNVRVITSVFSFGR